MSNGWDAMTEITKAAADTKRGYVLVCFTDREPKVSPKGGALHFCEVSNHPHADASDVHNVYVPLSNCYKVRGNGRYHWEVAMPSWLAARMGMI
jgi:hypothetical protein